MKQNNPNSLSSLLNISYDECMSLLKGLGLITVVGKTNKVKILRQKWEEFIINLNIGNDVYFEVTKVTKVPSGNSKSVETYQYNGFWIGIGHKKKYSTNPATQFKLGRASPPRKTTKLKNYGVQIKKLFTTIKYIEEEHLQLTNDDTSVNESESKIKNKVSHRSNKFFNNLYIIINLKMRACHSLQL